MQLQYFILVLYVLVYFFFWISFLLYTQPVIMMSFYVLSHFPFYYSLHSFVTFCSFFYLFTVSSVPRFRRECRYGPLFRHTFFFYFLILYLLFSVPQISSILLLCVYIIHHSLLFFYFSSSFATLLHHRLHTCVNSSGFTTHKIDNSLYFSFALSSRTVNADKRWITSQFHDHINSSPWRKYSQITETVFRSYSCNNTHVPGNEWDSTAICNVVYEVGANRKNTHEECGLIVYILWT